MAVDPLLLLLEDALEEDAAEEELEAAELDELALDDDALELVEDAVLEEAPEELDDDDDDDEAPLLPAVESQMCVSWLHRPPGSVTQSTSALHLYRSCGCHTHALVSTARAHHAAHRGRFRASLGRDAACMVCVR